MMMVYDYYVFLPFYSTHNYKLKWWADWGDLDFLLPLHVHNDNIIMCTFEWWLIADSNYSLNLVTQVLAGSKVRL